MSDTELSQAEKGGKEPRRNMLEVRSMTKVYPDGTVAVDDIDFSITAGDFCVIIGPSGCGKSTTLHSIVGKIPVTEGEIRLDGENITDVPTYERDIGLVFQDFQLFPHQTVEENILYGLKQMDVEKDVQKEQVDDILEMMRIEELRDRKPEELSAGQKQRVAVARSLVLEPKLLLLDEPLGDMDYKLQKRMERELLRIHRELDITFVYVTHDQTQAMRLGDQIVVMNDGKIEQSDTVDKVYNEPATAFVSTFVGDSNIFTGEIMDISSDETRAEVATQFGTFLASTTNLESDPTDVIGQVMPFSVRPQYMSLSENLDNQLECAVIDVIHQPGEGTQLLLEVEGDDGEKTEIQTKSSEILNVSSETVTIGWDAKHTTLLEKISVLPDIDLEKDILGE